jgi:hypothetical protein
MHTPAPTVTTKQPAEDTGPFRSVTSLSDLLSDPTGEVQVRALADGKVWIITSQAALRWDGSDWKLAYSTSTDMQAALDDGGQLWVLYPGLSEISALHGDDWLIYGAGKGWVSAGTFERNWWAPGPWSIYKDKDGMLWVPMAQDVRFFDGNRWRIYTLADMGFPAQEDVDISIVHNIAMAKGGAEVWVGECYYSGPGPMGGGGVRWFDGKTWQGTDAPISSGCVSAMHVDDAGDVWLGTADVIWHYKHAGQSWTEYDLPKELLSGYNFTHPRQLIVDQAGDVWVAMQMCGGASCDGAANLYRIHAGEWSLIIEAEYWSSSFKQLVLDGNGQAWLFWEGMVYRLDDRPLDPFASIQARGVEADPHGTIWVVAGSGDATSLQVLTP